MIERRRPFQGNLGKNKGVYATSTAGQIEISKSSTELRIVNTGSVVAHVRISSDGSSATAADAPVLPGKDLRLAKGLRSNVVSYYSASSTLIFIQPRGGTVTGVVNTTFQFQDGTTFQFQDGTSFEFN